MRNRFITFVIVFLTAVPAEAADLVGTFDIPKPRIGDRGMEPGRTYTSEEMNALVRMKPDQQLLIKEIRPKVFALYPRWLANAVYVLDVQQETLKIESYSTWEANQNKAYDCDHPEYSMSFPKNIIGEIDLADAQHKMMEHYSHTEKYRSTIFAGGEQTGLIPFLGGGRNGDYYLTIQEKIDAENARHILTPLLLGTQGSFYQCFTPKDEYLLLMETINTHRLYVVKLDEL